MFSESNGKQERKHEAQLTILPVQHSKVRSYPDVPCHSYNLSMQEACKDLTK